LEEGEAADDSTCTDDKAADAVTAAPEAASAPDDNLEEGEAADDLTCTDDKADTTCTDDKAADDNLEKVRRGKVYAEAWEKLQSLCIRGVQRAEQIVERVAEVSDTDCERIRLLEVFAEDDPEYHAAIVEVAGVELPARNAASTGADDVTAAEPEAAAAADDNLEEGEATDIATSTDDKAADGTTMHETIFTWRRPAEWFEGKQCLQYMAENAKDGKVFRVQVEYRDLATGELGVVWATPEQLRAWPSALARHGKLLDEWELQELFMGIGEEEGELETRGDDKTPTDDKTSTDDKAADAVTAAPEAAAAPDDNLEEGEAANDSTCTDDKADPTSTDDKAADAVTAAEPEAAAAADDNLEDGEAADATCTDDKADTTSTDDKAAAAVTAAADDQTSADWFMGLRRMAASVRDAVLG
jgi:hypothetical protein